jgi:hypothetical protein
MASIVFETVDTHQVVSWPTYPEVAQLSRVRGMRFAILPDLVIVSGGLLAKRLIAIGLLKMRY